jgi:sterol desaturase/sphingolipid hydroxylase (fatty acid hydroxylase superfamily)
MMTQFLQNPIFLTCASDCPRQVLMGFTMYVIGTITFDAVHYALHVCWESNNPYVKKIGFLHQCHHYFFNRRLRFNDKYFWLNTLVEGPLEVASQILGICAGYMFLIKIVYIHPYTYILTVAVAIIRFCIAMLLEKGMDSNHVSYVGFVKKDLNCILVGPEFHALHHLYPNRYFSSFLRLFDWLFGTAYKLEGRRITITGSSGAFGKPLKKLLEEREGVRFVQTLAYGVDFTYSDYTRTIPVLESTDILILCHGSKVKDAMLANCDSFVTLIELFKKHRKSGLQKVNSLPEVWAIGSEIELHPAWGNKELQIYLESKRTFAQYAKAYYYDKNILYRHIVPSAFSSRMGPGLISGKTAVDIAMFFIRRGCQYVPVTYTTLAFWNFFKFLYIVQAKSFKKGGD